MYFKRGVNFGFCLFLCALFMSLLCFKELHASEDNSPWRTFHSMSGGCVIAFPSTPHHMKEDLKMEQDNASIQYDAYVSMGHPKQVYMMLIAKYPMAIDESRSEASLESFLSGIMGKGNKELVFADFVEVEGHKGVEFFIQEQSKLFKGRILIADNKLYLIAVEAEENSYMEDLYHRFIQSFHLVR